jgi:hypothetical protein
LPNPQLFISLNQEIIPSFEDIGSPSQMSYLIQLYIRCPLERFLFHLIIDQCLTQPAIPSTPSKLTLLPVRMES